MKKGNNYYKKLKFQKCLFYKILGKHINEPQYEENFTWKMQFFNLL